MDPGADLVFSPSLQAVAKCSHRRLHDRRSLLALPLCRQADGYSYVIIMKTFVSWTYLVGPAWGKCATIDSNLFSMAIALPAAGPKPGY